MVTLGGRNPVPVLSLLAAFAAGSQAPELPVRASRAVEFTREVEPLLRERCLGCHGAQQQMSGLRLDSRQAALRGGNAGPAIKPGDSASSSLILRVAGVKGVMQMPPAGKKLTAEEVGVLRAWIDQGAQWAGGGTAARQVHWSFQPQTKPATPTVQNRACVRNPVDAFILARLEREQIQPSPEADKATLLRRLSLDLIGLPPAPAEIAEFLNDNRPDAYERQVDRLLASPHYGEKWARHWLDLARYADSDGYEKDWVRPHAWRYRHWVINALNHDMPFDQFTVEQIAGDLLPNATTEQKVATGFHRNTLTNREGGVDNEQFRFENVVDRTSTVATVWLGLTMGCAQCHDHKYDPISQRDFYRMAAFFDNLEETDIDAPLDGELGPYLRAHSEYEQKRVKLLAEYKVPELQAVWEARMLEAAANPGKWTDWDLAWDCLLKLTEGGDGEKIIRKKPTDRTPRERDVLIDHFVRNYHFAIGDKKYEELGFKELSRKLNELKVAYPQLSQAQTVSESETPRKSHIRVRGDYKALGPEVDPGTPAVLPAPTVDRKTNRLDLARWLVSAENPLAARVTVNRIWQELFGQGIVKTSEDFGVQGDRPVHPELLDWLACEFMERGWSFKSIQKLIVTSATYRQSSRERPELRSKDPNNTLLARQSRIRLPAELIRDAALQAGGLLSLEIGGRSVRPPQPRGVAELGYADSVKWVETEGKDRYRRGLYIHFQRTTPYPLLANFDAPKSSVTACRRLRSNTPLQALNLLNDPVFVEAAQGLAYRLYIEAPGGFHERLRRAFQLTLGREPDPGEEQRLRAFFDRQKAIFEKEPESVNSLVSWDAGNRMEEAAWVALSSVLLNLDEFFTRG
jgi:hypothetical protein